MDINRLFRAAERKCGRVLQMLPKDQIGSPREYLMQILQDETLPTLDIVYPRQIKKTFPMECFYPVVYKQDQYYDHGIDDRYSCFRIPLELTEGCEIMSIKSMVPATQVTKSGVDGYVIGPTAFGFRTVTGPNKWGRYGSANMYEAVSMAQLEYADKMLQGGIQSAFRYYFYPPNIIYITRYYSNPGLILTATFNVKNDPNLISIPDTAFDAVKRLFILDVKATIYGEYALYNELDTPYGTISLNISDWATAEQDRNDLADQYRATAHYRTSSMRTG